MSFPSLAELAPPDEYKLKMVETTNVFDAIYEYFDEADADFLEFYLRRLLNDYYYEYTTPVLDLRDFTLGLSEDIEQLDELEHLQEFSLLREKLIDECIGYNTLLEIFAESGILSDEYLTIFI